jgi:hypothetical protein
MLFELLDFAEPVLSCALAALRIVVRDMGNGVDRVESSELVSIESARVECSLPDRHPLPFPYPERIRDICSTASLAAGRVLDCLRCVPVGSVRPVDERSVEMVVWRHD